MRAKAIAYDIPFGKKAPDPWKKPPNYHWLLWLMIAAALLVTVYCAVYLEGIHP